MSTLFEMYIMNADNFGTFTLKADPTFNRAIDTLLTNDYLHPGHLVHVPYAVFAQVFVWKLPRLLC